MKNGNPASVLKVARWEFLKGVRSPLFLVMTVFIPLIMGALVGGMGVIERMSREERLHIAITDETGALHSYLVAQLAGSPVTVTRFKGPAAELEQALARGEFDGHLHYDRRQLEAGIISLLTRDPRSVSLGQLERYLLRSLTLFRLHELGLDGEQVVAATTPVRIEVRSLSGEQPPPAALVAPMIVVMVLVLAVVMSGQVLMYGVIKEKRNRIVEILLSSISSLELLVGKIIGFGLLSLVQIAVWTAAGLAVASRFVDLGQLGLTAREVVPSLVFFVFGYLLFASLFAAVGATMKEAEGGSQAQGMVIMVPMIPLFAAGAITMSPNALWVRVMSHIPPFIPVTVLIRLASTQVPPAELVSALAVLVLSVGGFIYLGARVFEGGILRYDRALNLRDLGAILGRRNQ
ncbi:MAG: ABC transporter permease [bacterium]|nr:ABC transporter permease [bacterium]